MSAAAVLLSVQPHVLERPQIQGLSVRPDNARTRRLEKGTRSELFSTKPRIRADDTVPTLQCAIVEKTWKQSLWAGWDRWLPLAVVVGFATAGVIVIAAGFDFGIPAGDIERLHILYTEIGVQTTAGIFAIIISLSLVAIQFAAQEYSHRIMEYYLRSTMFWTTMAVYLAVIVVGIGVQTRATASDDTRIAAALLIGVVMALALLVPHFLITAAYLKPEFIVGKLAKRLTPAYARAIAQRGQPAPFADRLLPIVEIVERSIDRGDITTIRSAIDQIIAAHAKSEGSEAVDRYYLDSMLRIGRKAIAQPEELQAGVLAIEGVRALRTDRNAAQVIDALEELGFGALRRDGEVVVQRMIAVLLSATGSCAEVGLQERSLLTFGEISHRLAAGSYRRLLHTAATKLAEEGLRAADDGDWPYVNGVAGVLEEIGHDASTAQMSPIVKDVARGLQAIGVRLATYNSESAAAVSLALLRIERSLPRGERDVLAALAFARSEIEALVRHGAAVAPGSGDGEERVAEADPLGLADLWSETKD